MKATFTLFSYCHSSKKKKKKFRARLPWLLQVTVMLAIENSEGGEGSLFSDGALLFFDRWLCALLGMIIVGISILSVSKR